MSLWKLTALINFIKKKKNITSREATNRREINKRFPNEGLKPPVFALGHYLHPFFCGHLVDVDDKNIQKLIDNHPTTKEYFENTSLPASSYNSNNAHEDSDAGNT